MARAVRSWVFAGLFGLLPVLSVLAPASGASAQKRVAVSKIEGKGGQLVRTAAQRALKERSEVVVVPGDEVTRAAITFAPTCFPGGRAPRSEWWKPPPGPLSCSSPHA